MNLDQLLVLIVICAAVFAWWHLRAIKEQALRAAKSHCDEMDVQFLDEVVSLKNLWFKKNSRGQTQWWVSYEFEFSSAGDERYKGQVIMLGGAVQRVALEPHREL